MKATIQFLRSLFRNPKGLRNKPIPNVPHEAERKYEYRIIGLNEEFDHTIWCVLALTVEKGVEKYVLTKHYFERKYYPTLDRYAPTRYCILCHYTEGSELFSDCSPHKPESNWDGVGCA